MEGAINEEYKSIKGNDTWTLATLSAGRKAINSRWVSTIKTNQDVSIERYCKARLVARFQQVQGIDYEETYAPVAKYNSIRPLFAISAQFSIQFRIIRHYLCEMIPLSPNISLMMQYCFRILYQPFFLRRYFLWTLFEE